MRLRNILKKSIAVIDFLVCGMPLGSWIWMAFFTRTTSSIRCLSHIPLIGRAVFSLGV